MWYNNNKKGRIEKRNLNKRKRGRRKKGREEFGRRVGLVPTWKDTVTSMVADMALSRARVHVHACTLRERVVHWCGMIPACKCAKEKITCFDLRVNLKKKKKKNRMIEDSYFRWKKLQMIRFIIIFFLFFFFYHFVYFVL